jgi:hypothetical protein
MTAVLSFLDDEIFRAMDSGSLLWGDLLMTEADIEGAATAPASEPIATAIDWNEDDDLLENWSVPDLTLRKGIYENFPVTVVLVGTEHGKEHYSVAWHRKNLTEWRETRPTSQDEAFDYKYFCEWRLMYSLEHYSHIYTVMPARNDREICMLVMDAPTARTVDVPTPVAETTAAPAPAAATAAVTATRRALDVLRSFPVSWDRDGSAHYIKIHHKNIQALAASKGASVTAVTADVHADLLEALARCADCVVTSKAGYLCAVLMK